MRLKQVIILGLVAIASLIFINQGIAHDWYPAACCSGSDCAPIPCEAIIEHGRELVYRGLTFSGDMIKNSQDHQCHACIHEYGAGSGTWYKPYCIFIQNGS